MRCGHCGSEKDEDGRRVCWPSQPLPPRRTVCVPLDPETVDEDGAEKDPYWLGEEELPF